MFVRNKLRRSRAAWPGELKGYRRLLVLFALCLVLAVMGGCIRQEHEQKPATAGADDLRKIEKLNQTADDIYKLTSEGNIVGVLERMNEISALIPTIKYGGVTSVEGMNALAQSVVQAKRSFNSVYATQQDTLVAAARIKLVADALTHPNEPMWHQYYKVMKEDMRALQLAVQEKNEIRVGQAVARYDLHYSTIRAALFISREPSDIEKLDSLMAFMKTQAAAKPIGYDNLANASEHVQSALDLIFGKREDDTVYLPIGQNVNPTWWTLLMAAIILPVLAFASWRMYAERSLVKVGRNRKEEL